ncbi:MAG: amidase [Gammaproteobacteria bacterium]|nr:amidase [Gammaproteobacteria bacterium]
MNVTEYLEFDATGLAQLIKSKEVSIEEVADCANIRYEQVNSTINAVIYHQPSAVNELAHSAPEAPFYGVPFLVKDLQCAVQNQPMTMGSRGIRWIPDADCTLAQRWRHAGLSLIGKTNTPELGLIITTEPKAHGPTHNPHKFGFSSGGSSGGSAAAVVCGIVPMAHAGDGGGSIRFPAAWCGAFGFKPTRGLTPLGPELGEEWSGAVVEHGITRSVRDSAALLDVTAGEDIASPFIQQKNVASYRAIIEKPLSKMRIGVSVEPFISTNVDAEVVQAVRQTAHDLEQLGHTIRWDTPAFNEAEYWQSFLITIAGHVAATVHNIERDFGKRAVAMLEPATKNLAMLGRSFSSADFVSAQYKWQRIRAQFNRYLEEFDCFLSPTVPTTAVAHKALLKSPAEEWLLELSSYFKIGRLSLKLGLVEQMALPVLRTMGFTLLGNITGFPAMSLPLATHTNGLPIGVQVTGRFADDARLLQLAKQLESQFKTKVVEPAVG